MAYNKLTPEEEKVVIEKGTEPPFSGEYDDFYEKGAYLCRRCNAALYRSEDKFDAKCGWPSFDDEVPGSVERKIDTDGFRTEILCANCGAHLGHVFIGEGMTPKNTRHCVNSMSLKFVPESRVGENDVKNIILGGGCFWCIEALFVRVKGVVSAMSGYAGGTKSDPTYEEVSSGKTGHAEVVRIEYDPKIVSLEDLLSVFFYVHDPTSSDRQGEDVGEQYRSIILYTDLEQKEAVEKFIKVLNQEKAYEKPIVTEVKPLHYFYKAEEYHQQYFEKNPNHSYCQIVIAPKVESLKEKFAELVK